MTGPISRTFAYRRKRAERLKITVNIGICYRCGINKICYERSTVYCSKCCDKHKEYNKKRIQNKNNLICHSVYL